MSNRRCANVSLISEGGAFGGQYELLVDRKKAWVDPTSFLKDFFHSRDFDFEQPEQKNRVTENNDKAIFRFSLFDLAEGFFGAYHLEHMVRFLKRILEPGEATQTLLRRIQDFEWEHEAAIVLACPSFSNLTISRERGIYPADPDTRKLACLCPIGDLSVSRLNDLIKVHTPQKYLRPLRTYGTFAAGWYRGLREDVNPGTVSIPFPWTWDCSYKTKEGKKRSPYNLRLGLLQSSPQVILYHNPIGKPVDPLDDFDMVRDYPEIPTSRLKVVRK